jgi:hypothetical protein
MAVYTSSSAAASTPVVEAAAAALASLSVEPIFAKSPAAAVTNSGVAITNDMSIHPLARRADLDETGAQSGTEESLALLAWLAIGRGRAGGHGVTRYYATQPHTNRRGGLQ